MPSPGGTTEVAVPTALALGDDDHQLMRRVAAKDHKAFETLYYRYAARLGRYLSKLLKKRELVEEAINDVMLTVWQDAPRFDPALGQLASWLFGIAQHKGLKTLARFSKHSSTQPLDPISMDEMDDASEPSDPDDPERIVMGWEIGRSLTAALETLSPEHRSVIELAFFEHFSYPEIALITDCPVNTVKTRIFHARRHLRRVLAELNGAQPSNERRDLP